MAEHQLSCRTCGVQFIGQMKTRLYCSKGCQPSSAPARKRAHRAKVNADQGRGLMTPQEWRIIRAARFFLERMERGPEPEPEPRNLAPWQQAGLTKAERFRLQYRLDPEFAIKQRVRAALKRRRQGIRLDRLVRGAVERAGRSGRAEAFLGYTMPELRDHLERQFTRRMSWRAFCEGRIHIDHIVPLSSFDLSNPAELRRAWCMTNLRPAWARDNLAKGARRETLL